MKFLDSLLLPLRVWQILGMAPFGVAKKPLFSTNNTYLYVYTILLLIAFFVSLVLSLVFSPVYVDWNDDEGVSKYDDMFAITMAWATSCVIAAEAIIKVDKQMELLQQIIRIDFVISRRLQIQIDYASYQFYNNVFTLIWSILTLICAIGTYFVMCQLNSPYAEGFWLFYCIPFTIYSMNYHRMAIYILVIRRRYKILNEFIEKVCLLQEKSIVNKDIIQIVKMTSKISFSDFPSEQLLSESQMKDIRNVYQMLYDATILFNEMFLWSLPLCIGIDFHRLLVNAFYVFAVWLLRSLWMLLVMAAVWGGSNIIHLIWFSCICHSTCTEVSSKFRFA